MSQNCVKLKENPCVGAGESVASLHMILFQINYNNGADQTARMRRLVCACVIRKPQKTGFLAHIL